MKTVRVKLLTPRVSDRSSNKPGDLIDMPADEATRLVKDGGAEWLEAKPERAVNQQRETQMQGRSKR